eukprot:7099022-Prymnesium_polylepis.1
MHKYFTAELKQQRAAHAFEVTQLLGEQRAERAEAIERTTRLEGMITELERQLQRSHAALRKGTSKEAERALEESTKEPQRIKEGRVWANVRSEEEKRRRAEGQRDELKAEVIRLTELVNAHSRKYSAEMDE